MRQYMEAVQLRVIEITKPKVYVVLQYLPKDGG